MIRSLFLRSRAARYGAAALSGVALAFCFPDVAFSPLVFVALAPLIAAIVVSRGGGEALLLATFSSTITWLINVPWVIRAMTFYGGFPFAVAIPLYVALTIALGLFTGLFFGLPVRWLVPGDRPLRWLLIPAAWVTAEFARTHLLSGFPWNQLAAAIIDLRPLIQIDALIGPYAVGFLIVVPSAFLAWLAVAEASSRTRMLAGAAVAAMLAAWGLAGALMLRSQERRISAESTRQAALLQPNITQQMRWGDANVTELFLKMIRMTDQAVANGASVVVWPESTVPLMYLRTPVFRDTIEDSSHRADIILGSVAEDDSDPTKLWNAAYLASGGKTVGRYDKIRLVPFGEYVPLRKVLFFAEKLVRVVGEFQFGTSSKPLVGRFRYGPAICYEVVYPQIGRTQARNGATVLVTITNDGWYDGTAALRQHLNIARLRSVETDRYLLRAATTGISALVDPTGRVVAQLGEGTEGILMSGFAERQTLTPYVRFGDWFAGGSVIAVILAVAWRALAARRR